MALFATAACDSGIGGAGVDRAAISQVEYARTITWEVQDTAVFRPLDFAVKDSLIYVADRSSNTVRKLDSRGRLLAVIGRPGGGPGEIGEIRGLAVSPDGGQLAVSDAENARVTIFTTAGAASSEFPLGDQRLGSIAFDHQGRLHVDGMGPVGKSRNAGDPTVSIYSKSGERIGEYGSFRPGSTLIADVYRNMSRFQRANHGAMWILMPYRGVLRFRSELPDSTPVRIVLPRPPGESFNGSFIRRIAPDRIVIARAPVARDVAVDAKGHV